jgi:hypothetical protein
MAKACKFIDFRGRPDLQTTDRARWQASSPYIRSLSLTRFASEDACPFTLNDLPIMKSLGLLQVLNAEVAGGDILARAPL